MEYLPLVWLSDIRAAGTMSHKLNGFRKTHIRAMLLINRTVMLIVAGNALGFSWDLET